MYQMKLLLKRFWQLPCRSNTNIYFSTQISFIYCKMRFVHLSHCKKSVNLREGLGIVQSLHVKRYNSVGDLAKDYFKTLIACFEIYGCVIGMFDRYDVVHSTKSAVIIRRFISSGGKGFQVIEGRSIPDWKKFLCTPENKQGLVKFLGDYALKRYNEFFKTMTKLSWLNIFKILRL